MPSRDDIIERQRAERAARLAPFAERIGGWDALCRPCGGTGTRLVDGIYDACPNCHGTGAKAVAFTEIGRAVPLALLGEGV